MSISSIAALSFLFVMFMSMDRGFSEFFEDDTGVPTDEQKDLFEVKGVMEDWVYLISALCMALMVLVVANTGIITVVERRLELASLRAIGIPSARVSILVAGSLALILYGGILLGTVLGLACIPLLDRVNLTIGAEGIGFPFAFDWKIIGYMIVIGTLSGTIGSSLPLYMMMRSSPLEVLRDG
jgi:ABC-type lipoprotein release transport system permease subunit